MQIFGLRTENEGLDALEDFIKNTGAPYALQSDNSKIQTGNLFQKILRKYNIKSEYTEPHHPHQNLAERRIEDVKRTTAKILDMMGAPWYLWFYGITYTVTVLKLQNLSP